MKYILKEKKRVYMDTQLSPANALRTRNSYTSYLSGVGYTATQLYMLLRKLEPGLSPFNFVHLAAM